MTFDEFCQKYKISLNDQQAKACQSIYEPTLLLAVPGSGKTTTLVARLGWMIYGCGILPEDILTVTYTVAATKDMKERFIKVFGPELADRLEFRTINGICAKFLSDFGYKHNRQMYSLLTDEGERSKIVNGIYLRLFNAYPDETDTKQYLTLITYIKNMMFDRRGVEELESKNDVRKLWEMFTEYQKYLRNNQKMDYDDQMVHTYAILSKYPEELAGMQEKFSFICVDEAQDTSKIQHLIINLLARKDNRIFMVGDEDQSIYGFRAAYPEALLDFEKTYDNAKVLLMETNYRSTKEIVKAADKFIKKNRFRHEKSILPDRDSGVEIEFIKPLNREYQYRIVVERAKKVKKQTAILYRDNDMIIPIADRFERNNIPYRIKGGEFSFFTHKIVKDVIDIIDFIKNPDDAEIFSRIYYKIGTFLTKNEASYIVNLYRYHNPNKNPLLIVGVNYFDSMINNGNKLGYKAKRLREVWALCNSARKSKASEGMNTIIHSLQYENYLKMAHISDNKLGVLQALANEEANLFTLKDRLFELKAILENKKPDYDSKIICSTIHSSKGLEYDTVYIIDEIEGLFPTEDGDYSDKAKAETYEEERRIFYVGITRAKNELKLFDFGSRSPFVSELKEKKKSSKEKKEEPVQKTKTTASRPNRLVNPQKAYKGSYATGSKTADTDLSEVIKKITASKTLVHKQLGPGKILDLDGGIATIEFKNKTGKYSIKALILGDLIKAE